MCKSRGLVILAGMCVLLMGLCGSEARAQVYGYPYGPSVVVQPPANVVYTVPYAYPYPGYYYPNYSYYAPAYVPGYYWSANRYYTPYSAGWNYQTYSPWTNQYYYRYGVRPRYR